MSFFAAMISPKFADLGTVQHGSKYVALVTIVAAAISSYVIYMLKFHPLAKFPGPWYLSISSLFLAIISATGKEPEYFLRLVRKYGNETPIRISPNVLFFPSPSSLKDIYWNPHCNQKARSYGSGILGPPHLFATLDGDQHRVLRKALSNAPWTIGAMMKEWEPRFDEHITLFSKKMREHASAERMICLSDKMAEFAADIMSMISFTEPFGCVANQRDERRILENFRKAFPILGFATRFHFFGQVILQLPMLSLFFLPSTADESGMGWLLGEAQRQVDAREEACAKGEIMERPDFLQHCLDARFPDGSTLSPAQKTAHVTLLIQAGADTTATSLGSTLRFLAVNRPCLERVYHEIRGADEAGLLSHPIQYSEARRNLPYFCACIKESLRLNPPVSSVFPRVTAKGGRVIDGHFIPGGTDITSHSYSIQRDQKLYGDDVEEFRPERWLVSEQRNFELEALQFTFGHGFRVCMGKDIALMELHKLLPELVRNFEIELVRPGQYVVIGGIAYNKDFMVKLVAREGRDKVTN